MGSETCNSFHEHAGCRCIRAAGHDGYCWSKAQRHPQTGAVTRCEWVSESGVFKRHHQYATNYPSNATRENQHGK